MWIYCHIRNTVRRHPRECSERARRVGVVLIKHEAVLGKWGYCNVQVKV